jgi:pimeloyl-ACP methyl ester carboxylesterase
MFNSLAQNTPCELVSCVTADGIRLHGAWHPGYQEGPLRGVTLVTVHGAGGNFYSSHLFRVCTPSLLSLGVSVLWTNNRGHDGLVNTTWGRQGRQGAAFEIVDECRLDLQAWQKWLTQHAAADRRILWGHSLGAIKSLYALSREGDAETLGVIACSPVVLSRSEFKTGPHAAEYQTDLARAQALIENDQGGELFAIRHPIPLWISARSYLDKYGPEERYNFLKFLNQVACPVLLTYGKLELTQSATGGEDMATKIHEAAPHRSDIEFCAIEKANHFYTDGIDELAQHMERWLLSLTEAKASPFESP